jgi:lysophospholipase L1-like esterase/dienelactone hydrolase
MRTFKWFVFFISCSFVSDSFAQRYKDVIYERIDTLSDVPYHRSVGLSGQMQQHLLDVYLPPQQDTSMKRPLMIFIHGGGFRNNTKVGAFNGLVCTGLAQRGYVAASIDYRLGIDSSNSDEAYFEAFVRAVQDAKSAVRYLKENALAFRIDTAQVFIMGSSAGAMTALGVAYLDQYEVPVSVSSKWGLLNPIKSTISTNVHGVVNCWGALTNLSFMKEGDVPVFSVHGEMDKTVPFDSSYSWHGFKYGSLPIFEKALKLGLPTGYLPFPNTGHTLDSKKEKQSAAFVEIVQWLFTQLKHNKSAGKAGIKRFEKEILVFDSLNNAVNYPANSVLVTGSSFVRLWKNVAADLAPLSVIHRGYGGSNIPEMAYYIERIAFPHNLKAVVLYTGSNDLTVSNNDKSPVQILETYKQIVQTIRKKFPAIPIIWIEISPSPRRWKVWDKIEETNTLIREYSASQPFLYTVSVKNAFLDESNQPIGKYFGKDNLHYNDEGYVIWGNTLAPQIHKILNVR